MRVAVGMDFFFFFGLHISEIPLALHSCADWSKFSRIFQTNYICLLFTRQRMGFQESSPTRVQMWLVIELISATIKEAHQVCLDPTVKPRWQALHQMLGCSYRPLRGGRRGSSYHSIHCRLPWTCWSGLISKAKQGRAWETKLNNLKPKWIPATIYPLGFILLKHLCDVHFTDLNSRFNSCKKQGPQNTSIMDTLKIQWLRENNTPPHTVHSCTNAP